MDQNFQKNLEQSQEPVNNLITLSAELLAYILPFLKIARDLMKMCYVSRLNQEDFETPSLWRDFIWPPFDSREE